MLVVRFIILFLVTTRTGQHALMLKKKSVFLYCPVLQLYLKRSVLVPVSLRPPSWIPSLLWLVSSHMPEPAQKAVLNQRGAGISYANAWLCDVVWCHKVTELKAGLLTRRFRSSVSVGEGSFCWPGLWPFNFKDLLNLLELIQNTEGRGIKQKSDVTQEAFMKRL